MKTKDKKELHLKTKEELLKMLKDAKDSLFLLRLEKASGKLKNTRSIFLKRRDIAQILTMIREKEMEVKNENI